MADLENHFTVFIRLPFNRGDFIDPPPVAWSAAKERELWEVISRQGQGRGNEIDWHALATQFEVTQPFILQQAAWLYERQLSQVRAQLRKVGTSRQSTTPSPAPTSLNSSVAGGQAIKRVPSTGSRVPSRLSTQQAGSPVIPTEGSAPPTPAKSRTSFPLRNAPAGMHPARAGSTSSRPLSRQPSKEEPPSYTHSRRGSTQQQLPRSPRETQLPVQEPDSDEEGSQSKFTHRRANPSSTHRRAPSLLKDIHTQAVKAQHEDDDDDSPSFLPFASDRNDPSRPSPTSLQDPSATLRGDVPLPRPSTHRRTTSERITSPTKTNTNLATALKAQQDTSSSTSSVSPSTSEPNPGTTQPRPRNPHTQPLPSTSTAQATLSPRQAALLRHRRHGSESSPSMGSSFSDLDDASITQSALEEALIDNMGNTRDTMTSRVSGIGTALRSRYFDASGGGRGARGDGVGQAQGQGQGRVGKGEGQQ